MKTIQRWNKENIQHLIFTNDKMVIKSLIQLYNKQTEDEIRTESTNHTNNQGFTQADAKRMTSMAKWAIRTGFLTQKQTAVVRRRLMKYANQLARIANDKMLEKV